jgi:hypothetical protein
VALTAPVYGLLAFGVISGCHKSKGSGSGGTNPETTQEQTADNGDQTVAQKPGRVVVPSGDLRVSTSDSSRIDLPTGQYIVVDLVDGVQYIAIEGVIDHATFSQVAAAARSRATSDVEFQARLAKPLKDSLTKISGTVGGLTDIRLISKYGFFTAKMKLENYALLSDVEKLPVSIVINPVVVTPVDERNVRKIDLPMASMADARATMDAFSGLKRMGVTEFLATVKNEITSTPDGASVNIGVADTGITYNHPSFEGADGKSRVKYMKDFTGEGRLYFNPTAKFEVTADAADTAALKVKAQFITPVIGATSKPRADDLVEKDLEILVSDELKALLLDPASGAKLAVLTEKQFESDAEKVDINLNGKSDDNLFAIVVNSGDSHKVFLDTTGELDFRKSVGLVNFNTSGATVKVGLEKFGLAIEETTLKNAQGEDVTVVGASIVGYDPGNHGSHVTGIISGRKTLSNDSDATLARGAAPNAPLMVNRVCANNGGCISTEAVIDLSENGADVVNMSLGGLSPYNDGYGVGEIVIDRLVETNNTVFVISAGNSGPGINTVGSPSTARHAISVGAAASRSLIERQYQWPGTGKQGPVNLSLPKADDDFMLFFSSRGPTAAGGFKPNIAAPGTELSAIQLNSANGMRAGLDVYWGTSMSAPAAAGAIALLIDAANRYNAEHPDAKLPVDALTIRKVIVASAKPFDAKLFNPETGEYTNGQYTWIDQGTGMINLPAAWAALKAERDSKLPSAVYATTNGSREDIALDYQIRVLRANPNGINYDGSIPLPADLMALSGPRFGRGVWLNVDSTESLVQVQIARRLPHSATLRGDVDDLNRLLVTSKDEFAIKTVIYGSNKNWLKAGTLNQLDCSESPTSQLTLIGQGAIDDFSNATGPRSVAPRDSTLMLCVDRAILSALPAGDHGALIKLYKKDGDKVESNPALILPVYVTVPNKTLAGNSGLKVESSVQSFGVARNYVNVPEGVNLVTVTLEVPEAKVNGNVVEGCMGVRLYAYEAGNTVLPAEINGTKSIAANCDDAGKPTTDKRKVTYSRSNPNAGIWNLHVFGRYQFPESDYKLTVEYAKVKTSADKIAGTPDVLNGSLDFEVLDSSFSADPSAANTTLKLSGLSQKVSSKVATDDQVIVPDADAKNFRSFDASVVAATISTDGSPGNDIDLYVLECPAESLAGCAPVGAGTTSTDVETVTFTPDAAKFYVALVIGYEVEQGDGSFNLAETRVLSAAESGTVSIASSAPGVYKIDHAFDAAASTLLKSDLFLSGKYSVTGALTIKTATGATMASVPVDVRVANP